MQSLTHILCVKCYSAIGEDLDVLLCNHCLLWQHKRCSEGVPDKFFEKFYLATVLGEKPLQWVCQYCRGHQKQVKEEPMSLKKSSKPPNQRSPVLPKKGLGSPLRLPPRPPCAWSDSSSDSDTDSDDLHEFPLPPPRPTCAPSDSSSSSSSSDTDSDNLIKFPLPLPRPPCALSESSSSDSDTDSDDLIRFPLPPPRPPCAPSDSSSSDSDTDSDDFPEFPLHQQSTADDQYGSSVIEMTRTAEDGSMMLINHRPIFSDTSSTPTLYTLVQKADGSKQVTDSQGNTFRSTQVTLDGATYYECMETGCTFQVRACEIIQEFLCCGSLQTHSHMHSRSGDGEDHDMSDRGDHGISDDDDHGISDLCECLSYDGNSEDDEYERKTADVTYTVTTAASEGMSFSSDSSDSEDLGIDNLVEHLDKSDDISDPQTCTPNLSHLSDITIPAVDSSEIANDSGAMTYTISKGPTESTIKDSCGYSYTLTLEIRSSKFWCCTHKDQGCRASLIQNSAGHFIPGVINHDHQPNLPRNLFPDLSNSSQSETSTHGSSSMPCLTPPTPLLTDQSEHTTPSPPSLRPAEDQFQSPRNREPFQDSDCRKPHNISTVSSSQSIIKYYEINMCPNRQSNTTLISSNGYIFNTKRLDNGTATWYCTERTCRASVVLQQTTDISSWLVSTCNAELTRKHCHPPDHEAVTLAKLKMMIKRRIFTEVGLDEMPKRTIIMVHRGLDINGKPYLDCQGDPLLNDNDRDELPLTEYLRQQLTTFTNNQKQRYRKAIL